MGIERSQAPLVLKASEPQPNRSKNPSDAEKTPGAFAAVMQAEAAPKAPERPKAADMKPPAEARQVEAGQTQKEKTETETGKTAKSAADEKDEKETSSGDEEGATSAAVAAAALALAATGLLGPALTKAAAAVTAAIDGKALARVDGIADGQQAGVGALSADGTVASPLSSVAAPAADAAHTALANGPPGASNLASYASVLEQLQSRLAKGEKAGMPAADGGFPAATAIDSAAAPQAASSASLSTARMDKLMNALQAGLGIGQTTGSETAKLASVSSEAGEALKAIDRFRGEAPRDSAGTMPDGAPGQQGFTSTVQFDGSAVSATASGPATADAVADQVGYWVSQGVQNAELTLGGAGAERVEVKISMSGNEAHVEFRSDQAATREMLAGTASQLRDLLSGQGVVLSGVTVGHAGAELAGGQQQQSRPREGRSPARGGADETQAVAAVRPSVAAGPAGKLDLFV